MQRDTLTVLCVCHPDRYQWPAMHRCILECARLVIRSPQSSAKALTASVFVVDRWWPPPHRYQNLPQFKVKMPENYINNGGTMTSNVDVITGLAALGMMDKAKALELENGGEKKGGWMN